MKLEGVEGNPSRCLKTVLSWWQGRGDSKRHSIKHSMKHPHEIVPEGNGADFQRITVHLHIFTSR